MNTNRAQQHRRQGAAAVLFTILMIPLLALVALAVDYGYLLVVRVDLQRTADQAVLAAVRDLEPTSQGSQNLDQVRARIREYVAANLGDDFHVPDSDIEIGRYDPQTIYTSPTILNNGIFDTVRVTLRRDDLANSSVSLFFARVIGIDNADVRATSTAVLQKAKNLTPGSDILPIAIPVSMWETRVTGDIWSIYGDGKMKEPNGQPIPGNWGTVDVGGSSNSSNDIKDQVINGLRQQDLDALYAQERIESSDKIDSQQRIWLNGDTGFSSGIKNAILPSHGTTKLVPIYRSTRGKANGMEFRIIGWGVVKIIDSAWKGGKQSYVEIQKGYKYDGDLRPHTDLRETEDVIDNAYTSPVLIE